MAFRSYSSFVAKASFFTLALGSISLVGCEAYKNYEERQAAAAEQNEAADYSCPNGTCLEDPGSRELTPNDCKAAESGYEFYPIPIMDLEHNRVSTLPSGSPDPTEYFALHSYTYDDDTVQNLEPYGWEPGAQLDSDARCGKADNHVLHLKGGPFLEWGGGIGRSMRCMNGNKDVLMSAMVPANAYWAKQFKKEPRTDGVTLYGDRPGEDPVALDDVYCHFGEKNKPVDACVANGDDPVTASACPERDKKALADPASISEADKPLLGVSLDLSKWEGVSFWARRTPNSQAGIRVLVGDKYTDDDISAAQFFADPVSEPYCRRTYECACKDKNLPCTIVTEEDEARFQANADAISRAKGQPPAVDMNAIKAGDGVCWDREKEPTPNHRDYQFCGDSACIHQVDSAKSLNMTYDPFIYGTQCRDFSFRGSITSKFCFNPDSELPIQRQPTEPAQVCGDHWMYSVKLSYDWEFYTVPFTQLLQQGWAKRSYWLDLKSVTMTRLTWDRGYVDFYIDDMRFYRKK